MLVTTAGGTEEESEQAYLVTIHDQKTKLRIFSGEIFYLHLQRYQSKSHDVLHPIIESTSTVTSGQETPKKQYKTYYCIKNKSCEKLKKTVCW